MFLSHQTYKGTVISVNPMIQATKYLLNSGVPFVLTERFNQDIGGIFWQATKFGTA